MSANTAGSELAEALIQFRREVLILVVVLDQGEGCSFFVRALLIRIIFIRITKARDGSFCGSILAPGTFQ